MRAVIGLNHCNGSNPAGVIGAARCRTASSVIGADLVNAAHGCRRLGERVIRDRGRHWAAGGNENLVVSVDSLLMRIANGGLITVP